MAKITGTKVPVKTWSSYCEEIGSSKKVVNEWLKRWFPDEKESPQLLLPDPLFSKRWFVEVGDIETYQTEKRFDFIVTDPPYPKEYLPLYKILAKRAKEWLKPNGLLIAMCGQSYLDEIYESMSSELIYYWTGCYLTPGQPTPLRQRQINTSWKPILIYSIKKDYSGKTFGDVYKSDLEDKDFHEWGQSVSGMHSLINQICLPNQSIFDPFCGAGTTGVAALMQGCLFHGIDVDEKSIEISRGRLTKIEMEIKAEK